MLEIVVTLIVIGVILWAVNTFVPMDGKIKTILNVVVILVVLVWLLQSTGLLGSVKHVQVK